MNNDRFNVVNYIKKLIIFNDKILINYPRKEFVLKDKIESTGYEMLELVYFINSIDKRLDYQKKVLSKISMMNFYFEQSYRKMCINEKTLNKGCNILESITKMIYGWIKSDGSTT